MKSRIRIGRQLGPVKVGNWASKRRDAEKQHKEQEGQEVSDRGKFYHFIPS